MNAQRYLFFICGQIGMMSLARFFFQWNPKYTALEGPTGAVLFAAAAVGGALLGFRIFDGITDPLAGSLSDSWVRRKRPRQQLLWFSFSAPAIGLVLCFIANHDMPPGQRWALLLSGLFIFFVGYTFYAIPYWSLTDDYAPGHQRERRVLSNLLGAGMMIATAIVFVATGPLVESKGYGNAAIIMGIVCAALMILPIFAAPARNPNDPSPQSDSAPAPSLWKGMGIALRHRRFIALAALFSGSQMSFTIMTGAAAFITTDILAGSEADVGKVMGPLIGMAIPGFLIVPRISKRFGWEHGMLFASIGLAVVYVLSGVLGKSIIGGPILTAGILFGLGGPLIALLLGLEPEGIVECATERGDSKLVGIYWGVFNFIVKILNGLALAVMFLLVGWRESVGDLAVRSMSFAAGGCLVLGVTVYFFIRKPRDNA